MKRRIFLESGAGTVMGGALSACGGHGDDPAGSSAGEPGSAPAYGSAGYADEVRNILEMQAGQDIKMFLAPPNALQRKAG